MKNGALGGKLLGAGGGGFMVFYLPISKQKKFVQNNKDIKFVPFNFTNEGSKIIFNEND